MAITVTILRAAGLSSDQIVRVLELEQQEALLKRREQNRKAQINHRSRKQNKQIIAASADSADIADLFPPLDGPPPSPPITPLTSPPLSPPNTYSGGRAATRPSDTDLKGFFERFWLAYPKRDGANPRKPAEKKFISACKSGVDPEAIIAGALRYARELRSKDQIGTPFVAQAVTWLNQQRWADYQTGPPKEQNANGVGWQPGMPTKDEILRKSREAREQNPSVVQGSDGHRPPNGRLV